MCEFIKQVECLVGGIKLHSESVMHTRSSCNLDSMLMLFAILHKAVGASEQGVLSNTCRCREGEFAHETSDEKLIGHVMARDIRTAQDYRR